MSYASAREDRNPRTTNRSAEMKSRNVSQQNNKQTGKERAKVDKNRISSASRIAFGSAVNNSDISADEADVPQQQPTRARSLIFEYADKISALEYRCNLCKTVSLFHVLFYNKVSFYIQCLF